jgi:hypothetical protein
MPPILQPADAADIPAIVKLMNAAYRGTGPDAGWNSEADFIEGDRTSEAGLRQELASKPESTLLVSRENASPPSRDACRSKQFPHKPGIWDR